MERESQGLGTWRESGFKSADRESGVEAELGIAARSRSVEKEEQGLGAGVGVRSVTEVRRSRTQRHLVNT